MTERVRDFGWNVLDERASQRDVQELWTAANRQNGKTPLSRRLYQGDLGFVPADVGSAALGTSGLSIKRRFYIFAARKEETVNAVENCSDGILAREGWYDDWYDACTFECGDVGIVEPHSMRPILEIRSCRYSDHST